MRFGNNLLELRNSYKLTQKQLGDRLDCSESTIGMYERDQREPNFEKLIEIANLFNCSVDFLIGGKLEKRPDQQTLDNWLITNTLSEKLKKEVFNNNVPVESLASQLRVPPRVIQGWINGSYEPGLDSLIQLCIVMKMSADYLLGIEWQLDQVRVPADSAVPYFLAQDERRLIDDYREASEEIREEAAAMLHRSAERCRQERASTNAG